MDGDAWPAQWLKGALDLAALAVLRTGPTHGYDLAQQLAAAGLGQITGGTLYPLLARLEAAGHITTEWTTGVGGPGRKYCRVTAAGHERLAREGPRWAEFAAHTTKLLTGGLP
jgi:PadR family transcriptional regulator, regulatory protein PadR